MLSPFCNHILNIDNEDIKQYANEMHKWKTIIQIETIKTQIKWNKIAFN